jgi:hypothetical protein
MRIRHIIPQSVFVNGWNPCLRSHVMHPGKPDGFPELPLAVILPGGRDRPGQRRLDCVYLCHRPTALTSGLAFILLGRLGMDFSAAGLHPSSSGTTRESDIPRSGVNSFVAPTSTLGRSGSPPGIPAPDESASSGTHAGNSSSRAKTGCITCRLRKKVGPAHPSLEVQRADDSDATRESPSVQPVIGLGSNAWGTERSDPSGSATKATRNGPNLRSRRRYRGNALARPGRAFNNSPRKTPRLLSGRRLP